MNANELRKGIWVNKGKYENIFVELTEDDLEVLFGARNYEDYNGIPLTPEILEKCGFVEGNYKRRKPSESNMIPIEWILKYQKIFMDEQKQFHFALETDDYGYLKEGILINYLHQLQNLYFALTGEEIQIDLHANQSEDKE